jgi:Family of unknown function (DUF6134)
MRYALLMLALLASTTAGAAASQEWRFRVFLEDREIGTHSFRVVQTNGERRVESDAQFAVKFLFIDAYTYSHRAREHWRGDCLATLDANTDDNGERLIVRGARHAGGFNLAATRGDAELPACVMPFAYWNPAMLKQPRLLNVQTGELVEVRVEALGEETVPVRGAPVAAQRYALHAPKFRIDVWYLGDREWVQLESRTESGRLLRYRIQ